MPDRQPENINRMVVDPNTKARPVAATPAPNPRSQSIKPAVVTLLVDGHEFELGDGELADPNWSEEILNMTRKDVPTLIQCKDWVNLPATARSGILALLGQYGDRFRLQIGAKQGREIEPFTVILQSIEKSGDETPSGQLKELGLEALRQLHSESPDEAIEKLANTLKITGTDGVTAKSLLKEIRGETPTSAKKNYAGKRDWRGRCLIG